MAGQITQELNTMLLALTLKVRELNEKPGARKNAEMREFIKHQMKLSKLDTTRRIIYGIQTHYFPFNQALKVLQLYQDLVSGEIIVDFKDTNGMPLYIHDQQEKQDE